eukprot:TRINITY_DN7746_c0_g1_i1.p1 TRINITY_DN7746_c0_g1~~TRINITY_DN7746_c0_g1_i1.p1  ORF type:complete len:409 (-),score=93.44 TRINITY_DN7746_c0_g1_i1:60-1238(-)
MRQIIATRFKFEDKKEEYFLKSEWDTLGISFQIELTDGEHIWFGQISKEELENRLKPQGMQVKEYFQLVKECLSLQDLQQKKFSYQLSQQQQDLILVWKVKLHDHSLSSKDFSFSVKGSVVLKKIGIHEQKNRTRQFFNWLMDKSASLDTENESNKEKCQELQKQRDDALSKFQQLVSDKANLEKDLYEKFLVILNEKKRKIMELMEEISKLKRIGPMKTESKVELISVGAKIKEMASGSESSEEEIKYSQKSSFSATPSLTFNPSQDQNTPNELLLSLESTYHLATTVRKRKRINVPAQELDKEPISPFESPKKLSLSLKSPTKETKKTSSHLDNKLSGEKKTPNVHFPIDSPRSPGMVTPTLANQSPRKFVRKKAKQGELDANDLLEMLE